VLRSGRFDELTRVCHTRYARRRKALVAALREGPFQFEEPAGGFFVWLSLADGLDSAKVVLASRRHGVLVSDGRNFFDAEPPNRHLRLSFSMLDEQLLVDGAVRLIDAVGA
jgi:DNA-binding transcriptional MocR family regulator